MNDVIEVVYFLHIYGILVWLISIKGLQMCCLSSYLGDLTINFSLIQLSLNIFEVNSVCIVDESCEHRF